MEPVIELREVGKTFKVLNRREGLKGSVQDLFSRDYNMVHAVSDISMSIQKGEMVGYLGPNGAGKSTTIKMMTGVLEPSSGEILVNQKVPYRNRTENAKNIGVVFGQRTQLWWALPVIESFKILKDIYQISDLDYKNQMEFYESIVDLSSLYQKPVRQMSLGQRTLSDILAAFLHNPSIVFLDEPTIGLDVSMKSKIRELITALNKEKQTTVILTTHDMGDVDALCKRIAIIDKGKMLYDDSIDRLRDHFGGYRTMKVRYQKFESFSNEQKEQKAVKVEAYLKQQFPQMRELAVSVAEEWISILYSEKEIDVFVLLKGLQEFDTLVDMKMEDISTESIIKKIYEGGIG